jgi:hypothetical protein
MDDKRERDTMQRGRFIHIAVLAGTLAMAGWPGRPALAAPPGVDAKGLPAGWIAAPLGDDDTLQDKQSVTVDNGKWTVVAAGNDLWTEKDGGMIVYQKHTGNGSVTFHLISQTGGCDCGWVKTAAGFRETLDPGSRDVHLSYTSANLLEPAIRLDADQTPTHPGRQNGGGGDANPRGSSFVGNGGDNVAPAGRPIGSGIWVGIEREGNTFRDFWSNDGKVWTRVAEVTQEFPQDMLAGIEATMHGGSNGPQTSVLDNVNVSNGLITPQSISNIAYLARDKSVLVVWNPAAAPDATYNVYRVNQNLSEVKKLNKDPIKESSFVVEGLDNGTQYRFAVSAVVNGVESGLQTPLPQVRATRTDTQDAFDSDGTALILPFVAPNAPVLGGFQLMNIGTATPGSVTVTGSGPDAKITLKAGGWDIWEGADGFAFLAMPMSGDLDVSARFVKGPTEVDGGGGWELGGPMFRESMDSGSRFAMAQVARANELQFKRRTAAWALPTNSGKGRDNNEARPVSARLVRKGDTFTAFYSEDNGKTWLPLGDPNTDKLDGFAKTALVGIALSAHSEGKVTEAEIDNFVIKPGQ